MSIFVIDEKVSYHHQRYNLRDLNRSEHYIIFLNNPSFLNKY